MAGLSGEHIELECISAACVVGDGSGLAVGVSPLGEVGWEATFARRVDALVGLPEPESLRLAMGA